MSPKTEQQFELIRQEKRQLILNTALELFARHGYHSTSISEIAKHAGISKGLMYNYFESKESLLKEIILDASAGILKMLHPDKEGTITNEEFFFIVNESFRLVKENTSFWKLYTAIILQPSVINLLENSLLDLSDKSVTVLINFFKEKGFAKPDEELLFFTAIIKGATIQYISLPEHYPIDLVKDKLISYYTEKFNENS